MLINLHAATINLKADLGGWQLSNSCRLDNGVETLKLILKNDEKRLFLFALPQEEIFLVEHF